MNRHSNFDILAALVPLGDGSYSTHEHENIERHAWGTRGWYVNVPPNRVKLCPWCCRRQAIAEFVVDNAELRTFSPANDLWAYVCADVREWCHACEERRLNA